MISTNKVKSAVLVIGAGSWGTALALVLARNGAAVSLWDADAAHIDRLRRERSNDRHLPGIGFPPNLRTVDRLLPVPAETGAVVIATPCEVLRAVLQQIAPAWRAGLPLCLACKGLAPGTTALNHEVAASVLGEAAPVAVLSGPSFAGEVAAGLPTAVTIAAADPGTAAGFSDLFHDDNFRVYTHDDVIGVQVGGAVKNIMAIAAGISDGLGFGANARSALITRGLAEIIRLGTAMGGRQETFMGLAGLGDLVLTCTDDQSRNRRFGLALARGHSPAEARTEIGQAIEGIRTAEAVAGLAARHGVEMPISAQVQDVIDGRIGAREAVHLLLTRERRPELD